MCKYLNAGHFKVRTLTLQMAEGGEKPVEKKGINQDSSDEEVLVEARLRVTEEEKEGIVPGSSQATEIARSFSTQPVNPMGCYRPPKVKRKKEKKSNKSKESDKSKPTKGDQQ